MEIIRILLPDHDPIQWIQIILLVVFVLLMAVGIYLYTQSEERWQAKLKELKSDLSMLTDAGADKSIKDLITTSWQDSFLQSLPGIFLIVGLLGTFISLGISLTKLSPAIDKMDIGDPSGIKEVLEALGTKFKTSIWGILFNLIFRLGFLYRLENTLSQIIEENLSDLSKKWKSKEASFSNTETTRYNQVISKNNEIITALQRIATAMDLGNQKSAEFYKDQMLFQENFQRGTRTYQVESLRLENERHNQLVDQNRDIISTQDRLVKEVGKGNQISTIFHEYQSRFQENFRNETIAHWDKSLQLQDESMKYLQSVSETLVPFGQSVKDLGPIIVDMKELVDMVSKTLTTATKDFGEVAEGLKESVSTFKTEIEKALKDSSNIMTKNAGEMGNSINRFNEQIKTSFGAFSESVNGTLGTISATLEKSTDEMKRTIADSIADTKVVIEKLDRHLGVIDDVLSETKSTLKDIHEKFSDINQVIDRVAKSAEQVAGDSSQANIELTGVFKENGILNKQLKALIESQEKLNGMVASFPQQRLTEIGQELGQIKDTIERLTNSNAIITDVFKENGLLNSQLQSLLNSQEKLNGLVTAFPQQRLTEIGQELGQIKNIVERLTNSTSTLYNELPSSLDGRGFLGTKLSSLIDNQQDIYKKIVDAIQANTDRVVHNSKEKANGEQEKNGEYRKDSELPRN
ncbi:hypothetical protein [Fibrella aquatilis]|uniref:MotA/TolQ/ExbB proton channel domain-containing protein n=1 Tax=Fibrella aquatilis TaxID=2817059 RepID=A0A939K022_9BACT|nr:hypothetical protein [Fibrella aquatilis]MBO0932018.1 hypothetical protein [Fibrella aquatilis]